MTDVLRAEYNIKCANLLKDAINKHPYLRLEQLLYILDNKEDFFNEEPLNTFKRWTETLNNLTYEKINNG